MDAKRIENDSLSMKEKAPRLSKSEADLSVRYREAMKKENGYHSPLPIINFLQVTQGVKCFICNAIMKNTQKAEHIKKCIGCTSSSFVEVQMQSAFGSKKTKFFEVFDDSEKPNWLFDYISRSEKHGLDMTNNNDARQQDSFMSTMKFNLILQKFNLEPKHACNLFDIESEDLLENVSYKLMRIYFKMAYNTAKSNMYIQTHKFQCSNLNILVGEKTVHRYLSTVKNIILFIINIRKTNTMKTNHESMFSNFQDIIISDQKSEQFAVRAIPKLHEILFSIFFSSDQHLSQMLPLFIACRSVRSEKHDNNNIRFLTASEMSPCIAAMLYLARVVVINHIYGSISSDGCRTRSQNEKWAFCTNAVSENHDCGATFLRFCMNSCNNIRNSETAQIRFLVCRKNGHKNCAIIDGHELSLERLGDTVKNVQKDAMEILDRNLMFGFLQSIDESFWNDMKNIKDCYTERRNGHWFLVEDCNKIIVQKWKRRFASHIIESPIIEGDGFIMEDSLKFMESVQLFLEKLYWLMQVSGGGPARATEIATIQFKNSSTAARHIFIRDGQAFYVLFYHKGREKMDRTGKPIARFPDERTSKLIILYLFFVTSLEHSITKKLKLHPTNPNEHDVEESATTNILCDGVHLFRLKGVVLDEDHLRNTFRREMKATGADIHSRAYRQYYSGVVKNFLDRRSIMEHSTSRKIELMHLQCGHSIETGSDVYGVSDCDMKKLDGNLLEEYRKTSSIWHSLLGIGHSQSGSEACSTYQPNGVLLQCNKESVLANTEAEVERSLSSSILIEKFNELMNRVNYVVKNQEQLLEALKEKELKVPVAKKSRPQSTRSSSTIFRENKVLFALRKLIGKEDA
ncbi:MAG: hypothetical protein AAGH46_06755, partial [Bacteroidota bacterium]